MWKRRFKSKDVYEVLNIKFRLRLLDVFVWIRQRTACDCCFFFVKQGLRLNCSVQTAEFGGRRQASKTARETTDRARKFQNLLIVSNGIIKG